MKTAAVSTSSLLAALNAGMLAQSGVKKVLVDLTVVAQR
jgi:hypothetical protein